MVAYKPNGLHWVRDYDVGPHWYARAYSWFYYVDMVLRGYLATYSSTSVPVRRVGKFDTLDEAMMACEHDAMCVRVGGYVGTLSIKIMHQ